MCCALVAMVTDYDCWKEDDDVEVDMILANLMKNAENVKRLIKTVVPKIPETRKANQCRCMNALQNAVLTQANEFPKDRREAFEFLLQKYL